MVVNQPGAGTCRGRRNKVIRQAGRGGSQSNHLVLPRL